MSSVEEKLMKLWQAQTEEFVPLVKKVRLNPAQDFIGADLRDMDLSHQVLAGFNFKGADFRGTDLKGASFEDAVLDGAIFDPGADPRRRGTEDPGDTVSPLLDAANNAARAEERIRAIRRLAKSGIDANSARHLTVLRAMSDHSGRVIGQAFAAFGQHFSPQQAAHLLRSAALSNDSVNSEAEIFRLLGDIASRDEDAFLDMVAVACVKPYSYLFHILDYFAKDKSKLNEIIEGIARHISLSNSYESSMELIDLLLRHKSSRWALEYVLDSLFQTKIPLVHRWCRSKDELYKLLVKGLSAACAAGHYSPLTSVAFQEVFKGKAKINHEFAKSVSVDDIIKLDGGPIFSRWLLRIADAESLTQVISTMLGVEYYKASYLARTILDFRPISQYDNYPEWPESALVENLRLIKPRPGWEEFEGLLTRLQDDGV